jgi:hypothetical protein
MCSFVETKELIREQCSRTLRIYPFVWNMRTVREIWANKRTNSRIVRIFWWQQISLVFPNIRKYFAIIRSSFAIIRYYLQTNVRELFANKFANWRIHESNDKSRKQANCIRELFANVRELFRDFITLIFTGRKYGVGKIGVGKIGAPPNPQKPVFVPWKSRKSALKSLKTWATALSANDYATRGLRHTGERHTAVCPTTKRLTATRHTANFPTATRHTPTAAPRYRRPSMPRPVKYALQRTLRD